MERLNIPERIAVGALVCILAREEGRDAALTLEWLQQFSKSEIKRAIRTIRATPQIREGGYPTEKMVLFLREEVLGKEAIQ